MKTYHNPTNKIEQDKNTYLLTCLDIASKILKEQEVFTPEYMGASTYSFVPTHANEVGENIAKTLANCRYHNMRLTLTGENFSYAIDLRSIESVKKELESELRIDWSKKRYAQKNGSYEHTIQNINESQSLTKDWVLNPKNHKDLAESFDSAEHILDDPDCMNAANNLETAKKTLELLINGFDGLCASDRKTQIKCANNMIDLWQEHSSAWEQVYKIGLTLDYASLAEYKQERAINDLAETNEAIIALKERENEHVRYISSRDIYDLFKANGLEPVNDIDLLLSLKVAKEINEEVIERIWDEESENRLKDKEVKSFNSFEDYLTARKNEFKQETESFDDRYKLKTPNRVGERPFKSVSHRERDRRNSTQARLERDGRFIQVLLRNEQVIKKYIK